MTNDSYPPIFTYIESTVVPEPVNCNVYAVKLFFVFLLSSVCILFVFYVSLSYCKQRCKRKSQTSIDLVNFDDGL